MTKLEQMALRMGFEFNNLELVRFGKIYVGKKKEFFSAKEVASCGIGLDDWDLLDQNKKEPMPPCPNCGCLLFLDGDDVHEGYEGHPVCAECKTV